MDHKENISQNDSHKKEARVIDSVLNALNDVDIDPELKRKMQVWFLSDFEDNPAKQDAFVRYADNIEPYIGELKGDDLARYNKLTARLGIKPVPVKEIVRPFKRESISTVRRVAAVLLPAAIVVGFWLMTRTAKPGSPEMMIAMSDQTQSVFLPDSSFVSVSPGSTVFYYEPGDDSRKVDLSGEAIFMVRKDNGRNFAVSTANMTVNVCGTDFAVSEYPESFYGTVELYEGSVNVETNGVNTTLSRGEKLSCDLSTHGIDISIIPASQMIDKGYKPRLKFNEATFGEVIVALSAFHEVEIEIAPGINTNAGSISGDIEGNTLENALRMILKMWEYNIAQKRDGEKITIYRK